MGKLPSDKIQEGIKHLDGWNVSGEAIRKTFVLPSFPDAIAFVNRVADLAERADHHPDILISYKRVTLTYSTHSEGGLTQKDLDAARTIDQMALAK